MRVVSFIVAVLLLGMVALAGVPDKLPDAEVIGASGTDPVGIRLFGGGGITNYPAAFLEFAGTADTLRVTLYRTAYTDTTAGYTKIYPDTALAVSAWDTVYTILPGIPRGLNTAGTGVDSIYIVKSGATGFVLALWKDPYW